MRLYSRSNTLSGIPWIAVFISYLIGESADILRYFLAHHILTFIDSQGGPVTEYDEALVRRLIEKVTVYDDHFTVEFKSGLKTDIMI